jgi:hypothetical protein
MHIYMTLYNAVEDKQYPECETKEEQLFLGLRNLHFSYLLLPLYN